MKMTETKAQQQQQQQQQQQWGVTLLRVTCSYSRRMLTMLPSVENGGTWSRITKGHISVLLDKKHLSQSYTRFIVGFCLKNMVLIIRMMNVGGAGAASSG